MKVVVNSNSHIAHFHPISLLPTQTPPTRLQATTSQGYASTSTMSQERERERERCIREAEDERRFWARRTYSPPPLLIGDSYDPGNRSRYRQEEYAATVRAGDRPTTTTSTTTSRPTTRPLRSGFPVVIDPPTPLFGGDFSFRYELHTNSSSGGLENKGILEEEERRESLVKQTRERGREKRVEGAVRTGGSSPLPLLPSEEFEVVSRPKREERESTEEDGFEIIDREMATKEITAKEEEEGFEVLPKPESEAEAVYELEANPLAPVVVRRTTAPGTRFQAQSHHQQHQQQQKPRLYFAYGSNLSTTQMHQRCPSSTLYHHTTPVAFLPGYKWVISPRGYANIVRLEESPTKHISLEYASASASASVPASGTDGGAVTQRKQQQEERKGVWGLLYTITPQDEEQLDIYEGVPECYYKVDLDVETFLSATTIATISNTHPNAEIIKNNPKGVIKVKTLVYIDPRPGTGICREEYRHRMRKGLEEAAQWGLPRDQVEEIGQWI